MRLLDTRLTPCARAPSRAPCSQLALRLAVRFVNDPSAGSPTETLLRLVLPLNDQV